MQRGETQGMCLRYTAGCVYLHFAPYSFVARVTVHNLLIAVDLQPCCPFALGRLSGFILSSMCWAHGVMLMLALVLVVLCIVLVLGLLGIHTHHKSVRACKKVLNLASTSL